MNICLATLKGNKIINDDDLAKHPELAQKIRKLLHHMECLKVVGISNRSCIEYEHYHRELNSVLHEIAKDKPYSKSADVEFKVLDDSRRCAFFGDLLNSDNREQKWKSWENLFLPWHDPPQNPDTP